MYKLLIVDDEKIEREGIILMALRSRALHGTDRTDMRRCWKRIRTS